MVKGFRNFLMQGELIVICVGLVVALAFSTLIKSFTDSIITPLVNAVEGGQGSLGLGWTVNGQRIELGSFIAAIVYFLIFMAVIYRAGRSLPGVHEEAGCRRLRASDPGEDVPGVPVRGPAARRDEVQPLREPDQRRERLSASRRGTDNREGDGR